MRYLAALMILAAGACASDRPVAGTVVYRVIVGTNHDYVDQNHNTWVRDQEYPQDPHYGAIGGQITGRPLLPQKDTPCPDVYLHERYGLSGYRFDVPNGAYTVRLHFAETHPDDNQPGTRLFSVSINGKTVLTDFNPFAAAGGFGKPAVEEFKNVQVTDGKVLIGFTKKLNNTELNGVEIIAE